MTPERWREVERLYHAALEHETSQRADFLQRSCGADDSLRREVESLLDYEPKARDFMEAAERGSEGQPEPGHLAGRVFGSYELKALIAAGGMGEVYRAVDTRLERTVAIKVLPQHLSDNAERRERFRREARLASSLNHEHICSLYHVGTEDGLDYLVMEHIDGETLQDRLKRGPVQWREAVAYLTQIAEALEVAHRQGIVHRDLKPANVMLTKSGVKVLDFGLAARRAPLHGSPLERPAQGSRGLTVEGRILGTLPYMSPEQLQGKPSDARADIFAFGALAHEMITGKPPFDADTQVGLIGAILKDDPEPIEATVPDVPRSLSRALARCLAKEPDHRWQTTTDLLFELRLPYEHEANLATVKASRVPNRIERALWLSALVLSLLAAAAAWLRGRDTRSGDSAADTGVVRFPLHPPKGTVFPSSFDVPFALAPDGRRIAYVVARADGTRHLWVHRLDSEEHRPLPGTEGASWPFWSPDSQWVAFFAANSLKKVRVTSPVAQVIAAPVSTIAGAAWNRQDVIVLPGAGGLLRVSANGGRVSPVGGRDVRFHLWPQFLDDGEHYIYASFRPRNLMISSLRNETPRVLMTFPVNVSALAYVPGFVFFVQDGVLFARPFDQRQMMFSGAARPIADGIPVTGPGRAPFSVSAAGLLAFSTDPVGTPTVLRWFTGDGRASAAIEVPGKYLGFALSPDGRELAFSRVGANGAPDVWVRDLDAGTERQVTYDGRAMSPRWSPDGSRLVFSGFVDQPPPTLFVKDVRSTAAAEPLGSAVGPQFAASWAGVSIVSVMRTGTNGNDLWMQSVGGQRERLPIGTTADESEGSVSRDGAWIAYTTNQSGRDEVWVASFPSGTLRRQVSAEGGISPQWCDGPSRIVYVSEDSYLAEVPFRVVSERIDLGARRVLFRLEHANKFDRSIVPTANFFEATPGCRRFLVATNPPDPQPPPITVFVNWRTLVGR